MKRSYSPPEITDYGDVTDITGIFGSASTGDVLVDVNGNVVMEGTGSIDACPTLDFEVCHINP